MRNAAPCIECKSHARSHDRSIVDLYTIERTAQPGTGIVLQLNPQPLSEFQKWIVRIVPSLLSLFLTPPTARLAKPRSRTPNMHTRSCPNAITLHSRCQHRHRCLTARTSLSTETSHSHALSTVPYLPLVCTSSVTPSTCLRASVACHSPSPHLPYSELEHSHRSPTLLLLSPPSHSTPRHGDCSSSAVESSHQTEAEDTMGPR